MNKKQIVKLIGLGVGILAIGLVVVSIFGNGLQLSVATEVSSNSAQVASAATNSASTSSSPPWVGFLVMGSFCSMPLLVGFFSSLFGRKR